MLDYFKKAWVSITILVFVALVATYAIVSYVPSN